MTLPDPEFVKAIVAELAKMEEPVISGQKRNNVTGGIQLGVSSLAALILFFGIAKVDDLTSAVLTNTVETVALKERVRSVEHRMERLEERFDNVLGDHNNNR